MNLILVSGVMRSGSTWAYNVARILGASAAEQFEWEFGAEYREGDYLDEVIPFLAVPAVIVIKTHQTSPAIRALINDGIVRNICTLRDPRDCVASRQLFKAETLNESIARVKESYWDAMLYGDQTLKIVYPDILERPSETVAAIARHLLLGVNEAQIEQIVEACSMEAMQQRIDESEEEVQPGTELHARHINGGAIGRYRDELTEAEQKAVTDALRREIDWYAALQAEQH